MNFTRSLLLGVFAASELGQSIRLRLSQDDCGAASLHYENCNIDIRAGMDATGIGKENEERVEYIFNHEFTQDSADWHELKSHLEAEFMYQIRNGYIEFELVTADDPQIMQCPAYDVPTGCEEQVEKKSGMTGHAMAEWADMINFNAFLFSEKEHWRNDYRDNSTTPTSHPGEGETHGPPEDQEEGTTDNQGEGQGSSDNQGPPDNQTGDQTGNGGQGGAGRPDGSSGQGSGQQEQGQNNGSGHVRPQPPSGDRPERPTGDRPERPERPSGDRPERPTGGRDGQRGRGRGPNQ